MQQEYKTEFEPGVLAMAKEQLTEEECFSAMVRGTVYENAELILQSLTKQGGSFRDLNNIAKVFSPDSEQLLVAVYPMLALIVMRNKSSHHYWYGNISPWQMPIQNKSVNLRVQESDIYTICNALAVAPPVALSLNKSRDVIPEGAAKFHVLVDDHIKHKDLYIYRTKEGPEMLLRSANLFGLDSSTMKQKNAKDSKSFIDVYKELQGISRPATKNKWGTYDDMSARFNKPSGYNWRWRGSRITKDEVVVPLSEDLKADIEVMITCNGLKEGIE